MTGLTPPTHGDHKVTESYPDAIPWLRHVRGEICYHVRHHFAPEAENWVERARLVHGPHGSIEDMPEADVLVPVVDDSDTTPIVWHVPFRGTRLTLWNRIPAPKGWKSWPSAETPLWYLRDDGCAMPAWDLFGNLRRLFALDEERGTAARDAHGRFTGAMSPRDRAGLLEVPALNEAAAALVALVQAQAAARANGGHSLPTTLLEGGGLPLRPAAVILSHDLDVLRGNDPITQGVRLYRWLRPVARGRAPRPKGLRALLTNARTPYRHYLDAIDTIVEAERRAGARSSFYFLNGSGGRFGARSGDADIPAARRRIPPEWNVGIHYNYDTLLEAARFCAQRDALERMVGAPLAGGRAHYLRFDPARSFAFLEALGVRYDETLGYPDRAGFRAGVAGAYHPPDPHTGEPLELVEIPLALMDVALYRQYPDAIHETALRLFRHLNRIGGTLSLLVHLETVGRPELDPDDFDYPGLLEALRAAGARFVLPGEFV